MLIYQSLTQQLCEKKNEIRKSLKDENVISLYKDIEMPLANVLFSMEQEGISIQESFLDEYGALLNEKLEALAQQIYSHAGMIFNINSPKQLANVLFDELNLSSGGKNVLHRQMCWKNYVENIQLLKIFWSIVKYQRYLAHILMA